MFSKGTNQLKSNVAMAMKVLRKVNKTSQGDMAKILGVSQSKISKMEQGLLELTVIEWVKLCNHFDIPVETLEKGFLDVAPVQFKGHGFNVRLIRPVINKLDFNFSDAQLEQFFNLGNLVSADDLFVLGQLLIDEGIAIRDVFAKNFHTEEVHGQIHQAYINAKGPIKILETYFKNKDSYQNSFKIIKTKQSKNEIVLDYIPKEEILDFSHDNGLVLKNMLCTYNKQFLVNIAGYNNHQPKVSLKELSCTHNGQDRCSYSISAHS